MPTAAYTEVPAEEQQAPQEARQCNEDEDERLTAGVPSRPIEIEEDIDPSQSTPPASLDGDFENSDGTGGYAASWQGYCNGQAEPSSSACDQTQYTLPDEVDNGRLH